MWRSNRSIPAGRRRAGVAGLVVIALLAASCGDAGAPTVEQPLGTAASTTLVATAAPPPPSTVPSTTVATTTTTTKPSEPTTTTSLEDAEPSQSPAEAERDGVVAELAALPIEHRVRPIDEIRAADGLWVVSRPSDLFSVIGSHVLGDTDGLYGRDFIAPSEYGEVLLMEDADGPIIRAWPLPGLPPQRLVLTEDAAYCVRQGDGALPDSMVCRIDRSTGDALVRVFPWVTDSGFGPSTEVPFPEIWVLNEPVGQVVFQDIAATDEAIAVAGHSGYALLDRRTLDVRATNLDVQSPAICSTTGLDLDLAAQPELPDAVAATRSAIFAAALACDYGSLGALAAAGDSPFDATFGGAAVPEYWIDLERRGVGVVALIARHLDQPVAASPGDDATYYAWPSAALLLTSADGDGLPPADYARLLELYTVEGLQEMFDGLGGYVGWRHGIDAAGEWLFFIAGD